MTGTSEYINAQNQRYFEEHPEAMAEMIQAHERQKRMADQLNFKPIVDANVVDNPNLRAHLPYPTTVYHWETRNTKTVQDFAEHQAALKAGWQDICWPNVGQMMTPSHAEAGGDEERFESLEARMLGVEQMLGEILERLPKPKAAKHQGQ